jgi:Flp pilus assembly pilin Flp
MIPDNKYMAALHRRAKNLPLQLRIWAGEIQANTAGQDLIEYALMAGFVAVAAGALMPGVAVNISKIFSSVASVLFNSKSTGS